MCRAVHHVDAHFVLVTQQDSPQLRFTTVTEGTGEAGQTYNSRSVMRKKPLEDLSASYGMFYSSRLVNSHIQFRDSPQKRFGKGRALEKTAWKVAEQAICHIQYWPVNSLD